VHNLTICLQETVKRMGNHVHFGQLAPDGLRGWAFNGDSSDTSLDIHLMLGSQSLGRTRDAPLPPPAEPPLGVSGTARGFLLPAYAVFLFARMMPPLPPDEGVRIVAGQTPPVPQQPPAALLDAGAFTPLGMSLGSGALRLIDIAMVGDFSLQLRLSVTPQAQGLALQFWQPGPPGGPSFAQLGTEEVTGDADRFVRVELLNPLQPVLIVCTDQRQELQFSDLLPFPSLLRGGLHNAELVATSRASDYLTGVRQFSASLLRAWLQRSPTDLGRQVLVSREGATGAQRIFREYVRDFLTRQMGAELLLEPAPDDEDAHGLDRINTASASTAARVSLAIPATGLPTLTWLTASADAFSSTGISPSVPPYLVAAGNDALPRWAVSLPPRPRYGIPDAPELGFGKLPSMWRTDISGPAQSRWETVLHAAILFNDVSISPDQRLYPNGPPPPVILPGHADDLSIVIVARDSSLSLASLLETIARQNVTVREIILVPNTDAGWASDKFGDADVPYRMLRPPEPAGWAACANAGIAAAGGAHVLLLDQTVLLHDSRLIDRLLTMIALDGVATAAPMVTAFSGNVENPTAFVGAGYFPFADWHSGKPGFTFGEINCEASLRGVTYPVAANARRVLMVSKAAWQDAGGFDSVLFPGEGADVDFGLRCLEMGLFNLCTTTVSALVSAGTGRHVLDLGPPDFLERRVTSGFAGCAMVRDLL